MKKKILFVITKSNFGGAQRYVYDLATSLSPDHYDVAVAFGGSGEKGAGAGDLASLLGEANIKTHFIRNFTRDIFLVKDMVAFFELLFLMRRIRPDVVHLNSSKAGGLGALAARMAFVPRIVFTAHGWPHQEPRNPFARALIWLFSWFTVLLSTRTIVVSDNDTKTAPARFKRDSLVRIHNGIKSDVPLKTRTDARHELQVFYDGPLARGTWIMTVAELTKNKNLGALITALKEVPDAALIIIGSGELKDELKRTARALQVDARVFFLGNVPDAGTYLPAADIFALPSLKEGLPYTVLEAGRAGVAVVASRVGGIPEIIEHEKNGLLVPPKDPTALSEAIKRLIADEPFRKALSTALKQKIERKFSLDVMIQKTSTYYDESWVDKIKNTNVAASPSD